MIKETKPHTFGGAREMTPEEKQAVDAAFDRCAQRIESWHEKRVQQLQQQLREKEARIARLLTACEYYSVALNAFDGAFCSEADGIVDETEKQSLAHIRADAVEAAINSCKEVWKEFDHPDIEVCTAIDLSQYAANLRAEGK